MHDDDPNLVIPTAERPDDAVGLYRPRRRPEPEWRQNLLDYVAVNAPALAVCVAIGAVVALLVFIVLVFLSGAGTCAGCVLGR